MLGVDRFITANNIQLHYLEWGDSAAVPVVLLHGGSAHAHWWDGFAEAMADTYRVLALDFRGHGDSAHVQPPAYHIVDYASDVAAWADAIGLARFHLIGHSLGGMVASAYASRDAERLISLVIVDTQLRISTAGARYMTRLRNFPHPIFRDRDTAIRRFRLLPTQTSAAPHILAHVASHALRQLTDGRLTLKFDRESLAQPEPQDLAPALCALTCPILIVRGEHSTLLSHDRLAQLVAASPHAQSVEIAAAHHHVMLDNPMEFERVVRTFLGNTGPVTDNRHRNP